MGDEGDAGSKGDKAEQVGVEGRGDRVYEIVRLVRPMTLNSARAIESGLRAHGLTVGTRAVLEILAAGNPMTVPEVASVLDVSRQATQRLVNELEEAGHTRFVANPRHQRSHLVELTARGTRAFAAVRSEELARLAALAPGISDRDLATAYRVMRALAEDIRRAGQTSRQGAATRSGRGDE